MPCVFAGVFGVLGIFCDFSTNRVFMGRPLRRKESPKIVWCAAGPSPATTHKIDTCSDGHRFVHTPGKTHRGNALDHAIASLYVKTHDRAIYPGSGMLR